VKDIRGLRLHPDWIVPEWAAPANVKAFVTTRAGGVSRPPYDTLNVGFSTDDDPEAVRENRARLDAWLPTPPRWLKQVHGARVLEAQTVQDRPEADASFTRERGAVCVIQVADCLPVLLTDRSGSVVAAAHAGWRGLASGVIDNTVAAMTRDGTAAEELLSYIGPGIGPSAFEVGNDVREAYVAKDAGAEAAFAPLAAGKWLANLPALARRALMRCGVNTIHGGDICTYSDPARFYSYRRDRTTGRMAALIWRE
jgi:YfiH family protein